MVEVRGGWWKVGVLVVIAAGCARRPAPPLAGPSSAPVMVTPDRAALMAAPVEGDWKALGDEATALLSQYLRINTTNPPGNEIAAARWLAEVLRARGVDAEVVTVAGAGLSSAGLTALLPDVLRLHPDAIVLDTGHNEYLTASALLDHRWWHAFRIGQQLDAWIGGHAPSGERMPEPGHGFDHATVVAAFAAHLRAIKALAADAGVPLLLCAPVSNLADCPPVLGDDPSLPEDGDAAFERGRALLEAGDLPAARAAFERARDVDRWPHRAGSALLAAVHDSGIEVVPVDRVFDEHSARGSPGFDLFADHCHPTPAGQRLMALVVADALEDLKLFPLTGQRGRAPSTDEVLPRLGADAALFSRAAAQIGRTFTGFALMSGRDGLVARVAQQRLDEAAALPGPRAGELEANFALLDLLRGERQSARRHLQTCADLSPDALARVQRLHDEYPWVRAVFARNGLALRKGELRAAPP